MNISNVSSMHLASLDQSAGKRPVPDANESVKQEPQKIQPASAETPWLTEPGLECIDSMEEYISVKKTLACISLEIMKSQYESFIDKLRAERPELANKSFSFTINSQGNFEVSDPQGVLNSEEIECLTQQLNAHDGLKTQAMAISYIAKTLVKYDLSNPAQAPDGSIPPRLDFQKILKSEDSYMNFHHQLFTPTALEVSRIFEKA
ncbi:hypothetical protein [Pseudomonas sp. Pseu.R1]|uniref:hypothetical protein n=1 Tax=Pseudomonas sp. Pseu.R1 TaxID=3379818 RepID=UPI003B92F3DF